MLTRSFLLLRGVDEHLEREFWQSGILSWDDLIENLHELPYHPRRKHAWRRRIEQAEEALTQHNARFFERYLPASERWRMLADFQDRTAYLDVEAYQWRPGKYRLTLAGLIYRNQYHAFIRGKNLHELPRFLNNVHFIVTFGGQNFDMRMLFETFDLNERNFSYFDFQPLYKRLNLPQGLKKLERLFGWRRGHGLDGLSGWVAVQLWERHQEGDDRALKALIRYNFEDVIHLPFLAAFAYNKMIDMYNYPFKPLPLPELKIRRPYFDRSIIYEMRRRFNRRVKTS